jgi:hypothetical protein
MSDNQAAMPVPGDTVMYVTWSRDAMAYLPALVWNVDGDRLDLFVSTSDGGGRTLLAYDVPMATSGDSETHTWMPSADRLLAGWHATKAEQRRADYIEDMRIIATAQDMLSPELRDFELVLRRRSKG